MNLYILYNKLTVKSSELQKKEEQYNDYLRQPDKKKKNVNH